MADTPPKPPRRPRNLTIPFPDEQTVLIIDTYAKRRGLDRATAAEHLIAYGALHYGRMHRGGTNMHAKMTPAERTARALMMLAARRDRLADGTTGRTTIKSERRMGVGGLRPKMPPI